MKNEEKQLLLIDLCARLPYGVKGKVETTDGNKKEIKDEGVLNSVFIDEYGIVYVCIEGMEYEFEDVIPYLRPMSSMTEEEYKEYDEFEFISTSHFAHGIEAGKLIDWLNAHHFDYRNLIEKGLAIEAPEVKEKEEK